MKKGSDRIRQLKGRTKMATVKKATTAVSEDVKKDVKKEPVKAEAKPVAKTEAKAETKPVAAKAETKAKSAVKTETKPAAAKAKKTEVKAPAKKASKPAAKKAVVKEAVSIQFDGKAYTTEDLVKIAKDVWKYDLKKKVSDFESVELYVKPEESLVYYVINGDVTGNFAI